MLAGGREYGEDNRIVGRIRSVDWHSVFPARPNRPKKPTHLLSELFVAEKRFTGDTSLSEQMT